MKKYIFLIIGLLTIDTITKLWAEKLIGNPIGIIPEIFSLHYAQNTGIAFSFPLSGMLLKIVTVILILGIFYYYWTQERTKKSPLLHFGYSLIFAGALGNAWERLFRGYVTDFLSLEFFAIFNLADSYITLGALCVFYFYYKNP